MIFLALTEQDNILSIHFGEPFGLLFYCSIAFVVMSMALWLLYRRKIQVRDHSAIVFDESGVTLSASLGSLNRIRVPYQDLKVTSREKVERTGLKFIRIEHKGEQIRILDMGFTRVTDFDAVFQLLIDKAVK
jgi:uncharacterized protein (DUF58 family)